MTRVLVWFSCGVVSAVAARETLSIFGLAEKDGLVEIQIIYCDTSKDEHPDNQRFRLDIEKWLKREIKVIGSKEYKTIWDVFDARKYLRNVESGGAPCTIELKKRIRMDYEQAGDIHIMGFAGDEEKRFFRFKIENPELQTEWVLKGISKADCGRIIQEAGIELPMMYRLGYPNANCMGCVKAESIAYWQHIRRDFPDRFKMMAERERRFGFALNRQTVKGERKRIFLDELPEGVGEIRGLKIECGVACQGTFQWDDK